MSLVAESSGTKTADGTEQELYANTSDFAVFQATVSLDNMLAGDVVTIRTYTKVLTGGSYEEQEAATFAHDQGANAVTRTPPDEAPYAWKVTLEQSSGTYRDYDWHVTTYQKNP